MTDQFKSIQLMALEALHFQSYGFWQTLELLNLQAADTDHQLANAFLGALSTNPLQEPQKGRTSLNTLEQESPRSSFAIALGRSLLALAQEQILTGQRESAVASLRQAIAWNIEAAEIAGIPIPSHVADQLLSEATQLEQTLASQLNLALASQRKQLPAELVLVLGMHRSGTSALSGLLVKSGLDGPIDLMPATENNPRGYYESAAVMHLNEQLLNSLGYQWSTPSPIQAEAWKKNSRSIENWQHEMLKLLGTIYPPEGRAVLKDPRLCILLPALRPWLESALMPCTVFLLVRHPAEVAQSLWAAEGVPKSQGLMIWIYHMIQAERYSRGLNRIIMGYQEILDDTEGVLHRCHQALSSDGQLNTSFSKPGASSEPLSFIDPQLHRQKVDAGIPDWCHEATACRCYTLAMRIFDAMIEHQSSASKLGPRMDDLWREWVSFLP
jgi:hypothetical protein